jgi:hypothetical protein
MVAWLGNLRARRRYGIEHVPSYGSNPSKAYVRRPQDVERTDAPRRCYLTAILDRLRSAVLPVPPAAWQEEIADQQITEPERYVPDRSHVKLHRLSVVQALQHSPLNFV